MQEGNFYKIKKGDTFWGLEREWGLPHGTLQKLNPKVNPRKLQIGEGIKIKMPTLVYLVAEEISDNNHFIHQNKFKKQPIDNLYVHRRSSYMYPKRNRCQTSPHISYAEKTVGRLKNARKIIGLENIRRSSLLYSNELWHFQKNGVTTYPWKRMSNGASHWKNNIVSQHRATFRAGANAKSITPSLLRKGGYFLAVADIGLSGEIKPSHVVSVVLVGASTTGVGAIFAGVYFIADIGTGLITGKSISERLDGWVENNYGKLELYEGYY